MRTEILGNTLVGAILLVLGLVALPALADPIELKVDTPKLDTAPLAQPKAAAPLKGKIERNEKTTPNGTMRRARASAGGFPFAAGRGRSDSGLLNGRANNNNLAGKANNFQVEATSGVGIIGVKFVMSNGRPPVINRVFPQTPAFQAGLRIQDVIVAVDGVPTYGLSKEEVFDMIVGTPGTPVTISIQRDGDFLAFSMNRMDLNEITDPFIRRDYLMSI